MVTWLHTECLNLSCFPTGSPLCRCPIETKVAECRDIRGLCSFVPLLGSWIAQPCFLTGKSSYAEIPSSFYHCNSPCLLKNTSMKGCFQMLSSRELKQTPNVNLDCWIVFAQVLWLMHMKVLKVILWMHHFTCMIEVVASCLLMFPCLIILV